MIIVLKYLQSSFADSSAERSFSLRPKWKLSTNSAAAQIELNKVSKYKTLQFTLQYFYIFNFYV